MGADRRKGFYLVQVYICTQPGLIQHPEDVYEEI
jgi:hypothetical protein